MPDKHIKIQIKTSAENGGDRETAGALNDPTKSAAQGSDAARDDAGDNQGGRPGFSPEALKGAIRALLAGVGDGDGNRGNGVVPPSLGSFGGPRESWSVGGGTEDGNGNVGNGVAPWGNLESMVPAIGLLVQAVIEVAARELRRGGDGLVPGSARTDNRTGNRPSRGRYGPASGDVPAPSENAGPNSASGQPNDRDPNALAADALSRGRSVDGGQSELLGALISLLTAVRQNQTQAIQAIADAAKNAAAQQALIEDARRSIANLAMRIGQTNNTNHH
jgi:hypothetical protein